MRKALLVFLVLFAAPAVARGGTRSQEPDTTISGFLRGLSDSTDAFFGASAEPVDTTGLDSMLAYGLENPTRSHRDRPFAFSRQPLFAFNRVDGPVWGGSIGFGRPWIYGKLEGSVSYAVGPNQWRGGGEYTKTRRVGDALWALRMSAGRASAEMNRDIHEPILNTFRALVNGDDRQHYYRTDGFGVRLARENDVWRAGVRYRDRSESPLEVTTNWDLVDRPLSVPGNLQAGRGHLHEFQIDAGWKLPYWPLTLQADYWTTGDAIGSDFEYRRTRVALAGNLGLGQYFSAVPQFAYGRLTGNAVPQAAFYLGGGHSLRSIFTDSRGGTGLALARLDLVETPDLLEVAHIPHPPMFPLQAGVFGAIGSVWGEDPFGGPTVPGTDWPELKESWLSETGVSISYQPGFPDPLWMFRFNVAWPLGPDRDHIHWSFSYTRAVDLVKTFGD